jgi:hypothetical protein
MFMSEDPWRAQDMRFPQDKTPEAMPAGRSAQGVEMMMTTFRGSVADWCDQGYSICEGYLIEAQNLYLNGDVDGFVTMAEALTDDELEDETITHINALLSGLSFCRRAGTLKMVETERGAPGLNWLKLAQLYRAMETTKGDMRMPRLDGGFERKLRAAMVLS